MKDETEEEAGESHVYLHTCVHTKISMLISRVFLFNLSYCLCNRF